MQMDDSYQSDQISFEEDQDYEPFSFPDNDIQNDKFLGNKNFDNLPLSPKVKEYFQKFKKYTPKAFVKLFNFKDQIEQNKSVCAKSIERGATIAQCYDCATDSSCIQCMECFKNSNHQGHKVVIKKAYGGCCDCGDVEAWKKEGFCKKHTGQVIDIQIDSKQQDFFVSEMKQLFFLMFWQSIQQNANHCREYSKNLLQSLCYLNQKGVYYNKLTCMVFSAKIPQDMIVSKNVNNRTILANILSPKVAKNLNIDEWMDLFFSMFQYYPFKKLLLSTYMKNFSIIYGDQQSQMRGSSISCQLLTSYQLVRDYTLQQGSVPLGSDINIGKITSFQRPFYMMYHDLQYITKLSGDTPQIYFKFHMTHKEGILKLFQYRKVIKNLQDKQKNQPDILQLARFVKYFQIQFKVMDIISKIAGILQQDKKTLQFVIKTLYDEALKEENQKKMIIFKPLTRVLTIYLFAYFDLELRNLDYSKNGEKIERVIKILQSEGEQFGDSISKLFKICVQSYLFHAKTLAEPGLNSTLYVYIFCYKMKNRLLSSVDILSVKMLSMMHKWPHVNRQPVIQPHDYLWQNKVVVTQEAKKQQLETHIQNLQFILSELNLVTASQSNQLYVAYNINPQCGLYQGYIENILLKILKQQKVSVTLPTAKQYEESFFHKNVNLAHNYLKKLCTFDKAKKSFLLNKQFEQSDSTPIDSLDYSDFRCNLTNKNDFQTPQKTLKLIHQSKGQQIFNSLWSVQNIQKFVLKTIEFMKSLKTFHLSSQNQTKLNMEKLSPLFVQLMKLIYLKRKITKKPDELKVLIELMQNVQGINLLINPFYESLMNPQKIQEEKQSQQDQKINQKSQTSPKKLILQGKNSSQQQRKKKVKQRMEKKKKSIQQRYAKQLAKFEQQEKNKLQKQQQQEQTQHKLNCIICKNDTQSDLIYFVHISYQNHQRLLGLGNGLTCLSIQSCYHAVDFACYQKLVSEVGNKKRPIVKCPFCKFRSNTFFPILSSSKHAEEAIKKFEIAIFMQKNIDQISILEQIVKSFYHFALLSYLDPQRTLHRRLKIYRIILQILKENSKIYSLSDVYNKFVTSRMNLNPKVFEEEEDIKRSESLLQLSMLLQNNEQGLTVQDLSQDQIQHLLHIMGHNESSSSQSNNNTGIFGSLVNKFKKGLTPTKNKQEQNPQPNHKYTTIFKETLLRFFKFVGIKQIPIQQEKTQKITQKPLQKISPTSMIQQELSPQLQICLQKLFDHKSSYQNHHHNNIYQDFNQNNSLLKLRDLPLNFKPLGKLNKCCFCQQITASMTLCLICDWQGCLRNCLALQKNEKKQKDMRKGGSFNHSRVHGEQSLFLLMQKCMVAKITSEGSCQTMGCIYKDEWGNDFENKKPWESFFLDEGELNKVKTAFLHQQ